MVSLTLEALKRYNSVLTSKGYVDKCERNRVLLLACIEEMVSRDFNTDISEEGIDEIRNLVSELSQVSCIIPYKSASSLVIGSDISGDIFNSFDMDGAVSLTFRDLIARVKNIEDTEFVSVI